MNTTNGRQCITIILLLLFIHTQAQDRAQDHNSSRSNKTASFTQPDDWTFGVNTGASFGIRANENGLFRGNSMSTKLFGRYHFGNFGLGFASGIIPGAINNSALNKFIIERKFQQGQVTKANPFNSYLLFGPSFRFGHRVLVNADIQGGMFINNPGAVSIGQAGAVRPFYRFEGGGNNVSPGFSGNISLAYPVNTSTRFFINTDYLQSKSSIRLYDPQQGIDVAVDQDRPVQLFTVGIGITKSFGSKRDAAGRAVARKKHIGNVYETLITEDAAMGERIIVTTPQHAINTKGTGGVNGRIIPGAQLHAINTKGTAATNGRIMNNENCGPVTQTITNPDGTMEELSFACPDDAAMYNERKNRNVTVPKQTQGTTFGEKVNAGLHAAGSALSQGASRGVISGNVSWSANNSADIITNQDAVSAGGKLSGAGGGAAAASYAATGMVIQSSTSTTGIATTIYTREAGSGMASGKRSKRDHASGLPTGRRQYMPVYNEEETNTCTGCAVTVKLIAHELTHVVQQAQVQNNPLYNGNGQQGTNPMYEGKSNLGTGEDDDCDGIAGLTVFLIDINNGAVVANTKTTTCGDFFFANVPSASYVIKLTGGVSRTKIYEATINSEGKVDMAGVITAADDHWVIQLNTGNNNTQKAGISTSRSNIRARSINIIETDLNGNGEFEPAKVIMEFNDGSSKDVTGSTKINSTAGNKKVTVRGWDPKKKEQKMNSTNPITEYTISIADADNGITLTSQYENGTKKEDRVISEVSYHSNVVQRIISLGGMDADAVAKSVVKTRTKSNNSNDRMTDADMYDSNGSASYTKTLPTFIGDMDGDGISEILTGNTFAASNNVIGQGASLLGGALPGGAVISAFAMPGTPIGGIIVKGGKNPGGSFRTSQTNEQGEFEFTGMGKGNYSIFAEVTYYMDDETIVTVGADEDDAGAGIAARKGWDGTVKGGSKINSKEDNAQSAKKSSAQDHNSSRSNKTASIVDDSPGDEIPADPIANNKTANSKEDNRQSTKKSSAQDHNSSRSNKTASIVDNNPGDSIPAKSIVNTTKSNTKDFLVSLDELDQLLNTDKTSSATAIRMAKENSYLLRNAVNQLQHSMQSTGATQRAANGADTDLAVLLGSIGKLGQQYTTISNVLKTKHDIAMNSIRNMK